jgi:hypothetical protein
MKVGQIVTGQSARDLVLAGGVIRTRWSGIQWSYHRGFRMNGELLTQDLRDLNNWQDEHYIVSLPPTGVAPATVQPTAPAPAASRASRAEERKKTVRREEYAQRMQREKEARNIGRALSAVGHFKAGQLFERTGMVSPS